MQTYPTLYTRDTTGNIRVWWMERDGSRYRTGSGVEGGTTTYSDWTQAVAKNVGHSNETSPEEQANSECRSEYEKKLKTKYHESRLDVDVAKYYKPMLAHDYTKRFTAKGKSVDFPVISQPKLDGVRCILNKDGAWSRTGKPILTVPHIIEAFAPLFRSHPTMVIDGELYNHDLRDDFDKLISLIRKTKPSDADLAESAEKVQYHVYDIPSVDDGTWRRADVAGQVILAVANSMAVAVATNVVNTQEELDELYAGYMEDGYEGQMIRMVDSKYEQKRSTSLLKRKEFLDDEFEIVAIEEGLGNWSGKAKRVVCKLADGRTFGAGLKGNMAYATQLLAEADEYVGKQVTVRYQNLTPDGVPRFPIAHALHKEDRI